MSYSSASGSGHNGFAKAGGIAYRCRWWLALGVVGAAHLVIVRADPVSVPDDAGTQPTSAPATEPTVGFDPVEKAWSLPGLHGTAGEIRRQLSVEIDHFHDVISKTDAEIAGLDAAMDERRKALSKTLAGRDSDYDYVLKTLAGAEEELSQATGARRVEQLNAKIEGFRKRQTAIEAKALTKDEAGKKLLAEKSQKLELIASARDGLKRSLGWRREVGSAVRGTMMLKWPLEPGKVGIPGQLIVTAYDRESDTVTAEGVLFVPVRELEKRREGIRYTRGRQLETKYVLQGLGITSFAVGQRFFCDKAVEVTAADRTAESATVCATRKRHSMDELLTVFREYMTAPFEGE